jgi:serine protease
MEKEYVVVVKRGVDLEAFDAELAASTGDGPIPSRSVDVANPRPGSKRMTNWMLTDDEAQKLYRDPRVLSVEIPVKNRDDVVIRRRATQEANFTKTTDVDSTLVNWGLRRCIAESNVYANSLSIDGNYDYAMDGTGVDVIIQDSGLQVDHPEFLDRNGNSRVRQIDWYAASGVPGTQSPNHYRDLDGHGTHCAGITAGLTYGWAKNADVYSQKLAGLEGAGDTGTGIDIADSFDCIRLWHNAKTNGRPTVVNMSWGYFSQINGDPTGGNYRGTNWAWNTDYSNDITLWSGTGIVVPLDGIYRYFPLRLPQIDAEIQDMIDAGIHVCIASGNDYYKIDVPTGADYNNYVVYGGSTYYYHQGSSPHDDEAMNVGNVDDTPQDDAGEFKDKTANSSNRGPGLDIWAPGTNIMSTTSNISKFETAPYFRDNNYNVALVSGTSMAAPQVAGVAALYLQAKPNLTPADLKQKLINDSTNVLYTTGLDSDYLSFGTSAYGGPNNVLYSRYGVQPLTGTAEVGLFTLT